MSNDLFPDLPPHLSPRLRWLRENCVTLKQHPVSGQWQCILDEDTWGAGKTEDEAILDYCETTGLKHYSLE